MPFDIYPFEAEQVTEDANNDRMKILIDGIFHRVNNYTFSKLWVPYYIDACNNLNGTDQFGFDFQGEVVILNFAEKEGHCAEFAIRGTTKYINQPLCFNAMCSDEDIMLITEYSVVGYGYDWVLDHPE